MNVGKLKQLAKQNAKMKAELVTRFQSAKNITQQLQRAEYESRSFSKKLAPHFNCDDDFETCKKVWYFLRNYLTYYKEPAELQTAKTIDRYIIDGKGDCKHYATASVGILLACGIPAWFAFVRQDKNNRNKGHIYCCALVENKIVVIDSCREKFNSECFYIEKYNIAPIKK